MRHAIAQTHLDGCLSFLHAPTEARHSLALDLAELFKPALTDALIFEAVFRDRLDANWFHQEEQVCRLSEIGRVKTLELWTTKLDMLGRGEKSLRMLMRDEALALERHVLGMAEYKPFVRSV
jgi:CRISPR-associated protein Cas1